MRSIWCMFNFGPHLFIAIFKYSLLVIKKNLKWINDLNRVFFLVSRSRFWRYGTISKRDCWKLNNFFYPTYIIFLLNGWSFRLTKRIVFLIKTTWTQDKKTLFFGGGSFRKTSRCVHGLAIHLPSSSCIALNVIFNFSSEVLLYAVEK